MEQTATLEPTEAAPSPSAGDDFLLLRDKNVSEEDRREILEAIEKVVADNRLVAGPALFRLKPKKAGFVFPLVVNLAAILAVVGGFVGSRVYFGHQQESISNQAGTFFSAEGKLLEEVRKESDAKLQQKDQEIQSIQTKLDQLNQESATLQANVQTTINAKEAELQQQMQSELDAEKARLQKLGYSQVEVDQRLKDFEQQKNTEFQKQLSDFRSQSEAALAEKEKEIQTQTAQTQAVLAQANQERQQLVTQAQQQEAELRSKYEAQTQQLQSANQQLQAENSAAQQKLQNLAAQSQNEQLLTDQIVGSYRAILDDIQGAHYDQANSDMASLQSLLTAVDPAALPEIAKRRPVDLQIIASLRDLIKARTQPGQPIVDPAVVERSDQVNAAEQLTKQGQAQEQNGDTDAAASLYTKAINAVPVVAQAYNALRAIVDKQQNQALAQKDATYAELKQRSDASIAQLQAQIAELKQQLQTANGSVADLTARLNSTNGDLSQSKSQTSSSQTALSTTQAQLVSAQAQLESAKQRVASLQTELDKTKADLTAANDKLSSANATTAATQQNAASAAASASDLQKNLDASTANGAALQKQVDAAGASNAELQQKLDAANQQVADLQKEVDANNAKIDQLNNQLNDAQQQIQGLQNTVANDLATAASIHDSYADYKNQILALIASGTDADISRAEDLLIQFVGMPQVNGVAPGFSQVVTSVGQSVAKSAENKGRQEALADISSVTGYLNSSAASVQSQDIKSQIAKKSADDPLFRNVAASIQQLADNSGAAKTQAVTTQYRLIGTVSYISAGTLTVERLGEVSVQPGDTVVIRHRDTSGAEVPVAEGTVTAVASDSVTVAIGDTSGGSASPQLLDVAYQETQAPGLAEKETTEAR